MLDDENLPRFKVAARVRAETFALDTVVPLYEDYYRRAIEAVAVGV